MKCPNCKDLSLVISERNGIEIDYCPECRGIWLDRGELDKILEKSRESESDARRDAPYLQRPAEAGYYQKPHKHRKSLLEELFD